MLRYKAFCIVFFLLQFVFQANVFSQKRAFAPIAGYLKDDIQYSHPDSLKGWKQRLYNEIRKEDYYYECSVLGMFGSPSELWRKADTLRELSSLREEMAYMQDPSYAMKYYAFTGITEDSDSAAFEVLKEYIDDTTWLSYGCACSGGRERFNESIIYEYGAFINLKYKYGGGSHDGKAYLFRKPDKKIWKQKEKELKALLEANELSFYQLDRGH